MRPRPRVAIVCEGLTDLVVLQAVLNAIFGDHIPTLLQPEELPGGAAGPFGGGWKGVRAWCQQLAAQGGLDASPLADTYDLLILHVDADIARDPEIACAQPAPPILPTLEALERVLLTWLQADATPERLVLCVPAQATEAWMIAMLADQGLALPDNFTLSPALECEPDPAAILAAKKQRRLADKKSLQKTRRVYASLHFELEQGWPQAVARCVSAARFDANLRRKVR